MLGLGLIEIIIIVAVSILLIAGIVGAVLIGLAGLPSRNQ
jgi:hypothetical protein